MIQYYCIEINGRYVGRIACTAAQLRARLGPYMEIVGNLARVYAPPPKA